jgi:hypothetical protein
VSIPHVREDIACEGQGLAATAEVFHVASATARVVLGFTARGLIVCIDAIERALLRRSGFHRAHLTHSAYDEYSGEQNSDQNTHVPGGISSSHRIRLLDCGHMTNVPLIHAFY